MVAFGICAYVRVFPCNCLYVEPYFELLLALMGLRMINKQIQTHACDARSKRT